MKKRNLLLGIAIIALGFTACKSEKETQAEKSVETYIVYVDSVGNIAPSDAMVNWETIDASYQLKFSDAEIAFENLKEKEKAQERINASKAKYETFKIQMEADIQAAARANAKQQMRNTLFGEAKISEDMNFSWVNKDNILGVYQKFIQTVDNNKDSYSREDWDEIKLMYEALDSRKNTVENEGLTASDNRKIAGLKLKFAPMYTFNRIGAKSDEMEKAKQ
ncbi:MAG: hypothetical protein NDI80_09710 [Flavobacteriaceae bacterium]|nr:hypothetical protein [Flavobacteriaceae bacterium]